MGSYKLPITGMTYSATIWEDIWTIGEVGDLFPHSGTTSYNSASDLLQGIVYGYSRDTLLNALLLAAAKKWKIRTGKTHLSCMGQCLSSAISCSWQRRCWRQDGVATARCDPCCAGAECQPLPRGRRWLRAQTMLLLTGWHQVDVSKRKFLFQNVSVEEKRSF